jgi:glycosyltransferase involved in cell wall biosynthesis
VASNIMLSVITPCYNEQDNVEELYKRVCTIFELYTNYDFEFLFIDNASTDSTVEKLKAIAELDSRVKIIVNNRNFGHIRSPYWGITQTVGAATIYLASDLQDPPELIPLFIKAWEEGSKVVMATKPIDQHSSSIMRFFRNKYYQVMDKLSDIELIRDVNGFGLYDKSVLDCIRQVNDPYPFLRGLICEFGYETKLIPFDQPRRLNGISKTNFYSLFDIAVLGIISHSNIPIRLASFLGFITGATSIFIALVFLVLKLFFWDKFSLGIAPIVIGMFLMFGILLLFIGVIGEYVASIHTYVQNRPIVVEKERINF